MKPTKNKAKSRAPLIRARYKLSGLKSPPRTSKFPALEVAGIALAIGAFVVSIYQSFVSVDALRDQQISAAWQLLSVRTSGSTGKQYALQTLLNLQGELTDVDLSCETHGGTMKMVDGSQFECEGAPVLTGLDLTEPWMRSYGIQAVSFEGAELYQASFSGNDLLNVNFSWSGSEKAAFDKARLRNVDFTGAWLVGSSFRYAAIGVVDFSRASLASADFHDAYSIGRELSINISGANFCRSGDVQDCTQGLTQALLDSAFFFENSPPLNLDKIDPAFKVMECEQTILSCKLAAVP